MRIEEPGKVDSTEVKIFKAFKFVAKVLPKVVELKLVLAVVKVVMELVILVIVAVLVLDDKPPVPVAAAVNPVCTLVAVLVE